MSRRTKSNSAFDYSLEERTDKQLVDLYDIPDEKAQLWLDMRKRCLTDLYFLCTQILGHRDFYEPLHKPLCQFVQDGEDRPELVTNVVIPRGHFKTTVECGKIIQDLIRCPNHRIQLAHALEKMAMSYLEDIKTQMVSNQKLKWLFPDVFWADPEREAPRWVKGEIVLKRTWTNKVPTIFTTGVDAAKTGWHASRHYWDDIVYGLNVTTVELRDKTRNWRRDQLAIVQEFTYLKCYNFATRWHWEDATQDLIDADQGKGDWVGEVRTVLRAALEDSMGKPSLEGEAIFPTRFSRQTLMRLKRLQGPYKFGCHYMNDPTPAGTALLNYKKVQRFRLTEDGHPPIADPYLVFTAVDPNRSEKATADYSAIVTAAITFKGEMWILDVMRGHQDANQLINDMIAASERWHPITVYVEENNYQYQIVTWAKDKLVKRGLFQIIEPVKSTWVANKFNRIMAMQAMIDNGGFHVREGLEDFMLELARWTGKRLDKDDQLDAASYIYQMGRRRRIQTMEPVKKREETEAGIMFPMFDRWESEVTPRRGWEQPVRSWRRACTR